MAVLLVMLFHSGWGRAHGGFIGVDVFFTLSGFLITSLLLQELSETGGVALGRFFARRALRLGPALLLFLLAMTVAAPWFPDEIRPRDSIPVLVYVANWVRALYDRDLGVFAHAWSLSIEEQFYLVWPLLLAGLWRAGARARGVAMGLLVATLVAVAYRGAVFLWGWSAFRIYNGTDTHADGLLAGACLAAYLHAGPRLPEAFRRHAGSLGLLALIGLVALGGRLWWDGRSTNLGGLALANGLTVLLVAVLTQERGTAVGRLLGTPVAVWIGRRSYGIYLWHYPIFLLGPRSFGHWGLWEGAVVGGLSLAAAGLSYAWVEGPFLRLKARFGSVAAPSREVPRTGTGR